ncbi:RagB/SusD family nutrient uptake outer membrane protein [Pedobacter sp. Du54]|uniref:RagB/SusD family nutrient uptake outer membrane protein n=1 Tax=Pedobacter anseongensis TaxID=3133439 RepID=UPI0030AB4DFD
MKRKIINYKTLILTICLISIFAGCKKYLEVKSDARLVVPSSLSDVQGLLDDATTMNLRTCPSFGDASSDDIFLPLAGYNAIGVTGQEAYTWRPTQYRFGNDWQTGYLAVYNCNLSLELMGKIERTGSNAQLWDNAKGTALFFRAYYFLMLTSQYGLAYDDATSGNELGIALRTVSDFNVQSRRATVKECYQQVIDDALLAYNLLPDYPQHLMRPSKGAVAALLSRCYLYMRKYDMALKYAAEALKFNNKLMNFNGDTDLLALTSAVPIKKFNKETIWYAELFMSFGITNLSRARVDSTLYSSYNANDLRKIAFFKVAAPYQQFKGSYAASASFCFGGFATDELYLTSAESKAALGDLSGAMNDLNTLMKTRWKNTVAYVPFSAIDKQDALMKIRDERRKELLLRGVRFGDIKRYNKEGMGIILKRIIDGKTYTLLPESKYYALPLPTDIIETSGMPQN